MVKQKQRQSPWPQLQRTLAIQRTNQNL